MWDVFDMSPTEVGRLALNRDCFRCAVIQQDERSGYTSIIMRQKLKIKLSGDPLYLKFIELNK